MFQPDQFRTYFHNHSDFAKSSKFEVRIASPRISGLSLWNDDLRFHCESAELPGRAITTLDNRRYGVPDPVAATTTYSDIRLTFICAGDFIEKKFFDSWMNYIAPTDNYHVRYKEYYQTDIDIIQYYETAQDPNDPGRLNKFNNLLTTAESIFPKISAVAEIGRNVANTLEERNRKPLVIDAEKQKAYKATLRNAFPVSLDAIPMQWNDDGILRLNVTIKYEYWTTGDVLPTDKPLDEVSVEAKKSNLLEKIQKFSGQFNR